MTARWKPHRSLLPGAASPCARSEIRRRCDLNLSGEGHVRVLVVVEDGASLTLVETQDNDAAELRNIGIEFVLGANAQADACAACAECRASRFRSRAIAVKVAKDAAYRAHFANFGAKLSRTDVQCGAGRRGR